MYCIVSHRLTVDGMHKRESFLFLCDGASDFGSCRLLFMAGSKVIGSSE